MQRPELAIQHGRVRLQVAVVAASVAEEDPWHIHAPGISQDHRHETQEDWRLHRHPAATETDAAVAAAAMVVARADLHAALPVVQWEVDLVPPADAAELQQKQLPDSDDPPRAISQEEPATDRLRKALARHAPSLNLQAELVTAASTADNGAAVEEPPRKLPGNSPPPYPADAYARRQTGRVLLAVMIDATGSVGEIRVAESSGVASLDRSALETVRQWRFSPARRLGQAVSQEVLVPIRFSLRETAG